MFTGLLTGRRQAKRALELSEDLFSEVQKLKKQQAWLEECLATLEGQHKTLRGRFYATRSGDPASPEGTREQRKAAALAKFAAAKTQATNAEH